MRSPADVEFEAYPEFEGEGEMLLEDETFMELPELSEGDYEAGAFETDLEASARPSPTALRRRVEQQRLAHRKFLAAIRAVGPRVTLGKDGGFRLAVPARTATEAAAKLGIDAQTFQALFKSMRRRNAEMIARRSSQSELEDLESAATCAGTTGVRSHWWGISVSLNECHTKALLDAMRAGSGVGTLCATVAPAPQVKVVCGALAALGGVGAAVISGIDSLGGNRGIVVSATWTSVVPPYFPPPVVWHQ
jgi:hypothetical protein